MALKTDGSLYFLGSPTVGEDGSGKDLLDSDDYGIHWVMDHVAQVSSGNHQAAALKTDGSVWAWGADGYSGTDKIVSTLTDQPQKPTKILDGMISVGMEDENGWAIDANGGLWSWGYNDEGAGTGRASWRETAPTASTAPPASAGRRRRPSCAAWPD